MLLFSYVDCGTVSMYSLPMPMPPPTLFQTSSVLLPSRVLGCAVRLHAGLTAQIPDCDSCALCRIMAVCCAPIFPAPQSHASKCYFLGLNFPVFFFQITHTLPVEISILNQVSSKEFICIDFYTTIYLYLLVHILYYACQFYLGHCFVQF